MAAAATGDGARASGGLFEADAVLLPSHTAVPAGRASDRQTRAPLRGRAVDRDLAVDHGRVTDRRVWRRQEDGSQRGAAAHPGTPCQR